MAIPAAAPPVPPVAPPAAPRPEPEPKIAEASEAPAAETPLPPAVPVQSTSETKTRSARPKRPSFLPPRPDAKPEERQAVLAEAAPSQAKQLKAESPAGTQSAAGLLRRLQRGLAANAGEPRTAAATPPEGWLGRIRRHRAVEEQKPEVKEAAPAQPRGGNMPLLRPNDLRAYLNQRLAAASAETASDAAGKDKAPAPKQDGEKIGPVLKSLDAVINHILAAGRGGAPRALLVAGVTPKVDATREAISIARALVARREQVVLVDIARGATAVSAPLGLPRAPGLTDLTSGRTRFEDVIRVDTDTALQVIAAGNPKLAANGDENERFTRVFEALMQAYDCVVLHADPEALRKLAPALKFELPVVVAVLPAGASANDKTELTDFSALGCPVLVYEQSGKERRSGLLGRVAAI
jgi:Mrp family chromosome partitioning ATPase